MLNAVFQNRTLSRAVNFTAYFLLLSVVAPEASVMQIVAGVLLGISLIVVIGLLICVLRRPAANAGTENTLTEQLCAALIPVGFLVMALVMSPPDSRIMPLLYLFLGLYILSGIARLVIRRK